MMEIVKIYQINEVFYSLFIEMLKDAGFEDKFIDEVFFVCDEDLDVMEGILIILQKKDGVKMLELLIEMRREFCEDNEKFMEFINVADMFGYNYLESINMTMRVYEKGLVRVGPSELISKIFTAVKNAF